MLTFDLVRFVSVGVVARQQIGQLWNRGWDWRRGNRVLTDWTTTESLLELEAGKQGFNRLDNYGIAVGIGGGETLFSLLRIIQPDFWAHAAS